MWGKSKKSSEAAPESPASTNTEVVVSSVTSNIFTRVISRFRNNRRMKFIFIFIVLVVLAIAGAYLWQNRPQEGKYGKVVDDSYRVTDEQFANVRASSLKSSTPPDTASIEDKKAYYDELVTNEYTAGNYKGATDAYGAAVVALKENNLTFNIYVAAARSYVKLGDKAKAEQVLNAAEQSIKAITTDTSLRDDFLATLSDIRKELLG